MADEQNIEIVEVSSARDRNIAQALYNAFVATLQANGVEHGAAQVCRLPNGDWAITGGAGAPITLTFQPGGGGFGGGGASGTW